MKRVINLNIEEKCVKLESPVIMGILNVTPDSFYSGSRSYSISDIVSVAGRMQEEGASVIDVGGYSTRPGAGFVTPEEEMQRVIPAISAIRREFPELLISVDTFRSEIAYMARQEAGADIVNDISGGLFDRQMMSTVSRLRIPYIIMHNRGTSETMHENREYFSLIEDIMGWFKERIECARSQGIDSIILDPGIGFSKSADHNFEIIARLSEFMQFGYPILAGISRKSMIYRTLGVSSEEALNGTTALNMAALLNGADILRVHDVKPADEVIRLYRKLSLQNAKG